MFELTELSYNDCDDENIYELSFPKPLTVKDFASAVREKEAKQWAKVYLVKDDNHKEAWYCLWHPSEPRQICEYYYHSIKMENIEEIADRLVSRLTLIVGYGPREYFLSIEPDAGGVTDG